MRLCLRLSRSGAVDINHFEADAGKKHQFYCNPDESMAQVRREILRKNLKELLDPLVSSMGKTAFMRKATGSVVVDRKVLGSVQLIDERAAKIQWYTPFVLSLGIDIAPIGEAFSALAEGRACP